MTTPRQRHALPSQRRGGPDLRFTGATRKVSRRVLGALVLLVVAAMGLAAPGDAPGGQAEAAGGTPSARDGLRPVALDPDQRVPTGGAAVEPAPAPDEGELPAVLAIVDDLTVLLPTHDAVIVGYHEASMQGVMRMVPVGEMLSNQNTTKFDAGRDGAHGTPYHVMSSRGRAFPATSAADIVMPEGVPVLSPVNGVVTEVRHYALYGRHPDTRIEIQPSAAPHLRVVLIHVADVTVRAGDEVTAGESVLAGTANRFPFASHVDRYTEPHRLPHVHLEVKDHAIAQRPS